MAHTQKLTPTPPGVDDKVSGGVDGQEEVRDVDEAVDHVVGLAGDLERSGEPAVDDLVQVGDDLDGLADDEENRDGDEDHSEVGLALLTGSHLGVKLVFLKKVQINLLLASKQVTLKSNLDSRVF